MRITNSVLYNSYISDILKRQEALYELNQQSSSGKKINAPSDDPASASKLLSSRSLLSSLEQYDRNIQSGLAYTGAAETALTGVKDSLVDLKDLAIQAANATQDATSRASIAASVKNSLEHIISLGNTTFDGKYVFSGYKTSTASFSALGAYQGDTNKTSLQIGPNSSLTIGVNGGEVFKGTGLPGGVDVIQIVTDFNTALNANDTAGINTAIGALNGALNQVLNSIADIGSKVNRLNSVQDESSNVKDELKKTISNLEDADLVKVLSELKLGQTALEASISSAGKVFGANIFQYL